MGLVMSATMTAAIHLWETYKDNLFTYRNTDFRGAQDIVRHHAETDLEPEARGQARLHDLWAFYSLGEIYFATWQSNPVVEGKGTRLFRFHSLSRKDA